jgi:[acyl-carrier-protein] S-malonyltransferase
MIFPGQGSQSVGMGRGFYDSSSAAKEIYEEASVLVGYDMAGLCFNGPADRLNLTEFTQPALLTASIAALRVLEPRGVRPRAVAGHSLGEYSAVVAAGGLSFATALSLVQKRGRYMAEAVPAGSGLVVALLGAQIDVVRDACREASGNGIVAPANFNSPGQIVIAGEKAAVERAVEIAKTKGCRKAIPLPVCVPVHTPLMRVAAERLAKDVNTAQWSDLNVPLINNAEAASLRRAADVQASVIRQLASPVRWEESVRNMAAMGVKTFIEVGPGTVLSGLVKRILPEAQAFHVQDPESLEETMTQLRASRSTPMDAVES